MNAPRRGLPPARPADLDQWAALPGVDPSAVRRHRYGVIHTSGGRLAGVRFRWWPRLVSGWETVWWERLRGRRPDSDQCWLYWAAPRTAPGFISLNYVCSTPRTSLATFRLAVAALDRIACLRNAHAIVCEAHNPRISDRLLLRWGYERHMLSSRRRHWIKRFYGDWSRLLAASGLQGR